MKAKEIAAIIESFAPLSTQEGWDNSGFCIGTPEKEIKGVLVGFDCTEALVKEAISCGADMIVTHHPLIFSGLKKISPDDVVGKAVYLAIQNDIVIYAAHTNADKAPGGVNSLFAQRLGLENVEPLDESGLALVGNIPQELSGEEFVQYVKERFDLNSLRCSDPKGRVVRKVAICAGSGASFISAAHKGGADAFISGDISYHHFFCEEGFMVMDIGHYQSEIEIVDTLFSILRKKLPTFAVFTTSNNNNPIYYY